MTGTNHHRGLTQHGSLSATELQDLRELLPEIEADVRRWLAAADRIPADPAGEQLAALLRDPAGLDFTVRFVDRVIRPEDHTVAARELSRLAADPPAFLPTALRAALQVGGKAAPLAPRLVVPIARRVLRHLVGHLLIDATDARLGASLARVRRRSQARLNLNLLGEAVLGRGEADRRLAGTLALLTRDDVDYVSIKVSATVAPHQPWAYAETVDRVMDRLRPLYRVAADHPTPKFINLDMEEYRDLPMTLEVFIRLLDEPELRSLAAGIVLQAYLPDALGAMQRLQEWAARRVASGGAPIKVRLVKGANLPMEHMDASLHGWPLATWHTKQDSDTHYKRVLLWALTPERVQNVRLGVAGHNLFDIALARQIAT
ncbi:MAG: proline dehydrogenase family protein, partial [Propionibacteriaceae bacterium]|nr:proline dehydrogenase family protein [Propionibacteriaceae bacterium]